MKILIVDDDEIIVEAICMMIEKNSLDIKISGKAFNAIDALDIIEKKSPDIVLTDITMPGMSGIDLMREIRERKLPAKIIVLSAYREFEYAQQALQLGAAEYILKPVSEQKLITALNKVMDIIKTENNEMLQKSGLAKDRIFYSLKTGKEWAHNIFDLNGYISINLNRMKYRAAVFEFNDLECWPGDNECVLKQEILKTIGNTFCGSAQHLILNDADFLQVVVIMEIMEENIREFSDGAIISTALKTKEALKSSYNMDTNIGISDPASSVYELPEAYKQAVFAARNKFYVGKETITVYNQVKFMDNIYQSTLSVRIDDLVEQVKLGMEERALNILDNVFKVFNENQDVNPDNIYTVCFEIVLVLRHEIVKMNIEKEQKDRLASVKMDELRKCSTIQELYVLLKNHISSVIQCIVCFQKNEGSQIIQKAVSYCKNNLVADITLESIAEYVSMNKSYFSYLFKKEMGENFWDYLTKLRITKAKELLRDTNLKSYVIAELVGYKNASHFGKVFKENVGLTPAEFKGKSII